MRVFVILLVFSTSPSAYLWADTVRLRNGLSVHGAVEEAGDEVIVESDGRTYRFKKSTVKSIERGESLPEQYARRKAKLEATDETGWFRLALWAREHKLRGADEAYERVLGINPDHRAARRELGYERVGEAWVRGDEAKRRKGFVLCGGRWVLPEEADRLMRAGLMEQAPATEEHRKRAIALVKVLQDDDPAMRKLAMRQIDELPDAALMRPMRKALYAPDPKVRVFAVKTLSRIGDRVALPWLIQSSMYDAQADVRNAAFRAIKTFRDEDVFWPYARALYSKNPRVRIQAVKAIADLDDLRGVDLILRRISIGLGASPRVNVQFGTQSSYVADFDVEIAQAAAIGDPIVRTIQEGVILDFKVLGGSGEQWIVQERRAYAGALANLTGRDFGENWKQYEKLAKEQQLPRVKLR